MADPTNIVLIDELGNDLNPYVLPATTSTLGTVKVGSNLSITADGTLSATGSGSLPDQTGHTNSLLFTDGSTASWVITEEVYPIVTFYSNNYAWYKIYANNWCEQGNIFTRTGTGILEISLLTAYKDIKYTVQATNLAASSYTSASTFYTPYVLSQTTTKFKMSSNAAIASIDRWMWEAKGFIA